MTVTAWQASAPSNIALIKYMGKVDATRNLPSNASLSFTLDQLKTTVALTNITATADRWHESNSFSATEQQRFIQHLQFLKQEFQYDGYFEITSANNFPAGCGLASSASSFAALTRCACQAFGSNISIEEMAALSRQGSGSSCRSFFPGWVLWQDETVKPITLPYNQLLHHVIVVSREKKAISSGLAHRHVQSSALYATRAERAEQRLTLLLESLQAQDWKKSYTLVWQEFWDMHALFETCDMPFGYILPDSLWVLQKVREYWDIHQDGPLVTMDAGPNVHLLFRDDQVALANELKQFFAEKYLVL